uniref:Uncharacterized protein n=1 Tax=Arundo donax TaxID=35708 RepID=A0A0A9ARY2_ARUDO
MLAAQGEIYYQGLMNELILAQH